MDKQVSKEWFWEMVRGYPEYKDGRLTDEQAGEIVERLYTDQEEIVRQEVKTQISRELIRMVARGEAEYDPERDAWRLIR